MVNFPTKLFSFLHFRYGGIPDFTHRSVQYLEKKAKLKSKFLDMRKPRKSKNTHIFFTEEPETSCRKNKTLKKVGILVSVGELHGCLCSLSCYFITQKKYCTE